MECLRCSRDLTSAHIGIPHTYVSLLDRVIGMKGEPAIYTPPMWLIHFYCTCSKHYAHRPAYGTWYVQCHCCNVWRLLDEATKDGRCFACITAISNIQYLVDSLKESTAPTTPDYIPNLMKAVMAGHPGVMYTDRSRL